MPLGADEFDVAQQPLADDVVGVVVQDAIVPLVPDRQMQVLFLCLADQLFALRDVVGHQLFAEDVLAGIQGIHGERRVPVERNGDHDGLDIFVGQELVVIVILFDLAGGRLAQLADQAHAVIVAVAHERPQAVRRGECRPPRRCPYIPADAG